MNPSVLRQLWKIIEAADPHTVAELDAPNLVDWIIHQLSLNTGLADPGSSEVAQYVQSRLPMIQDLVHERLHR
ncbi:MAG: hypothetical protein AAGF66_12305 [Cyanobacteria bacterium P01_H01_bin.119]